MAGTASTGFVIIGRDEGQRLVRCLGSVRSSGPLAVYVDSGSKDRSLAAAADHGVESIQLDMRVPFTAARARNAGFERLFALSPGVDFVQFIDGDCEICDGWVQESQRLLRERPDVVAVCGRVIERHPEASIYNRLCQLEWDAPPGETQACGGIAMYRAAAFKAVGGFNPSLIAGEEPELCLRLRRAGGKIWRSEKPMCLHDAAITRFRQWWRRAMRGGHAFAEGAAMHGRARERHYVRETRSNWFWGLILPVLAMALAWPTRGLSLLLIGGHAILGFRVYRWGLQRGWCHADARLYAFFCVLAKVPQVLGQIRYHLVCLRGSAPRIIEYKHPAEDPAGTA